MISFLYCDGACRIASVYRPFSSIPNSQPYSLSNRKNLLYSVTTSSGDPEIPIVKFVLSYDLPAGLGDFAFLFSNDCFLVCPNHASDVILVMPLSVEPFLF